MLGGGHLIVLRFGCDAQLDVYKRQTVDPAVAEVSHVNANDGTTEGSRYKNIPCFTVHFHPEACGGPRDTEYLFDDFVAMMKGGC